MHKTLRSQINAIQKLEPLTTIKGVEVLWVW